MLLSKKYHYSTQFDNFQAKKRQSSKSATNASTQQVIFTPRQTSLPFILKTSLCVFWFGLRIGETYDISRNNCFVLVCAPFAHSRHRLCASLDNLVSISSLWLAFFSLSVAERHTKIDFFSSFLRSLNLSHIIIFSLVFFTKFPSQFLARTIWRTSDDLCPVRAVYCSFSACRILLLFYPRRTKKKTQF